MAAEDVGKALEAIGDEALRQQVAQGDISGLPDLDLNEEERDLLIGAAADFPETESLPSDAALRSRPARPSTGKLGAYDLAAQYAFGQRPNDLGAVGHLQ